MAAVFTLVDDSDPSVQYGGHWIRFGGPDEFQQTTHSTNEVGAQATITFTGSSIEVFGTIGYGTGDPSLASVTSYTLDGDPSTTTEFVATLGSVVLYRQLHYSSPRLAGNKQHTLVITYTAANKNKLWFDYVRIEHDPDIQPTPQLPPQLPTQLSTHFPQSSTQVSTQPGHDPGTRSSSQLPPQLSSGLSTYSALQSSTPAIPQPSSQPDNTSQLPSQPNNTDNNTESPGLSKGVIAAIVVGSVVALLLIVMIVFLLRFLKRQSKRRNQTSSTLDLGTNSESQFLWPWNSRPSTPSHVSPFQGMSAGTPAPRYSLGASPLISQPLSMALPEPGFTTRGGTFADMKGPVERTPSIIQRDEIPLPEYTL
ncbi:hypothetical protein D9615_007889 [Tricholomella constricta]|uniref:Uncharacterized protein n=1 Tax=Tricholomella constricta TaxID=117010 RepID=A0A8H5H598_9AGAR|nr:hypothetical protein D9615_007889 [Tricholomella constricta]